MENKKVTVFNRHIRRCIMGTAAMAMCCAVPVTAFRIMQAEFTIISQADK